MEITIAAPASPRPVGIKRHSTPDSKHAERAAPWTKDREHNLKPLQPPAKRKRCQVCLCDEAHWDRRQPCLLNAHERPVDVPGYFCSKACYEHV